jgi:hypothetical protein
LDSKLEDKISAQNDSKHAQGHRISEMSCGTPAVHNVQIADAVSRSYFLVRLSINNSRRGIDLSCILRRIQLDFVSISTDAHHWNKPAEIPHYSLEHQCTM